MNIAIFQHTPTEPPGFFGQVFSERDIPCEYIRLYEQQEMPNVCPTHALLLGGPMSVNDEQDYPYLKEEKAFIRRMVKENKRVLGICLGAQLIAAAFGAKVYPYVREVGWHEVACEPATTGVFGSLPRRFAVFQFHRETFGIPYGGKLLCRGSMVKNQAFSYRTALGLQFHLELTEAILRDWSCDLRRSERDKCTHETLRHLAESNRICRLIADDFIGR
jgi:GMP synthase-like glutamine amidotransferase